MAADLLAFFSKDDFDCLDFDDVALLDKAQRQAVLASMDRIIRYFFRAIGYQHIVRPKDVAFRRNLWAWGYSRLTKVMPDNARLDMVLDTSASIMEYFYPNACDEAKMCTGTASAAIIFSDDLVEKPGGVDHLRHFSQRYLRGLPQPEGLCTVLADTVRDSDEFYGSRNPHVGNYSVMGWLAGVDIFCEEARFSQELPGQFASNCSRYHRTEWSVEKLPWHVRALTGLGSCYAVPIFKPSHNVEVPFDLWISAIPDLIQFICLVNDLLSFPKEVLALENYNYLSLITRARRQVGRTSLFDSNDGLWTFRDTLYETFDQVISHTAELDNLFITFAESLSEDFEAAQTEAKVNGLTKKMEQKSKMDREKLENARLAAKQWAEFRQGYVAWHINHPRYRLDKLRAGLGGTPDTEQITAAIAAPTA